MPTKGKKEKGRGGNLPFVVKRTNEAALGTVHSDRARQCTHTHCSGASHPLREEEVLWFQGGGGTHCLWSLTWEISVRAHFGLYWLPESSAKMQKVVSSSLKEEMDWWGVKSHCHYKLLIK